MRRFRKIALVLTVVAAAVGFVAPQPAHACVCDLETAFDAVSAADVVFVGDVVDVREPTPADIAALQADGDTSLAAATAQIATVEVALSTAELGTTTVEVRTEGGVGCEANLSAGMTDVVIPASRVDDRLTTTGCGGPITLGELEEILAFELPEPDGVGPIRMVLHHRLGPASLIALDDRGRILSYDPADAASRIEACDDGQLLEIDDTSFTLLDPATWERSERLVVDRDLADADDVVCIGTSPLLVGWTEASDIGSNAVVFDAGADLGSRLTVFSAGANATGWPAGNQVLSIIDGALAATDVTSGEVTAALTIPPSSEPPAIVIDHSAGTVVTAGSDPDGGTRYTIATLAPELALIGSFSIADFIGGSLSWNEAGQVLVSATSDSSTVHQVRATDGHLVAEATEPEPFRRGVFAGGSVFSAGLGVFGTSLATGERSIAPWSAFRTFDQSLLPIAGDRTPAVTAVPEMPVLAPQELAFADGETNSTPFPAKPILIAGAAAFCLLALAALISNRRTYRA